MTSSTDLLVPEHVHWRRFDAELVLVDLRAGEYHGLNDVAADAFERLARGDARGEIVRSLLDVYDVSEAALVRDIDQLVESLLRRGLLVAMDSGDGPKVA
jgi:hypothetical protein